MLPEDRISAMNNFSTVTPEALLPIAYNVVHKLTKMCKTTEVFAKWGGQLQMRRGKIQTNRVFGYFHGNIGKNPQTACNCQKKRKEPESIGTAPLTILTYNRKYLSFLGYFTTKEKHDFFRIHVDLFRLYCQLDTTNNDRVPNVLSLRTLLETLQLGSVARKLFDKTNSKLSRFPIVADRQMHSNP